MKAHCYNTEIEIIKKEWTVLFDVSIWCNINNDDSEIQEWDINKITMIKYNGNVQTKGFDLPKHHEGWVESICEHEIDDFLESDRFWDDVHSSLIQ